MNIILGPGNNNDKASIVDKRACVFAVQDAECMILRQANVSTAICL